MGSFPRNREPGTTTYSGIASTPAQMIFTNAGALHTTLINTLFLRVRGLSMKLGGPAVWYCKKTAVMIGQGMFLAKSQIGEGSVSKLIHVV